MLHVLGSSCLGMLRFGGWGLGFCRFGVRVWGLGGGWGSGFGGGVQQGLVSSVWVLGFGVWGLGDRGNRLSTSVLLVLGSLRVWSGGEEGSERVWG